MSLYIGVSMVYWWLSMDCCVEHSIVVAATTFAVAYSFEYIHASGVDQVSTWVQRRM